MNRKKKGGNSSLKPPALSKSVATPSPSPATTTAMPARVSPPPRTAAPPQKAPTPPQKAPTPPQNAPQPFKAVPHAARTTAQAPRSTSSPPKPPAPSMHAMKIGPHPAKPGPSQFRGLTRSDRVRAEWMGFEEQWVKPRQVEVEKQLVVLLEIAEKNSRVKGKALEQAQDRIINTMRREFVMVARVEWDMRLDKAGLQAEDWSDITPEEMLAVEQVLSCEEPDDAPGAFALSQSQQTIPTLSGKTTVEASPPMQSQFANGRIPHALPSAAQKTSTPKSAQSQPQTQSSSWIGWATTALSRGLSGTEAAPPEEPPKASQSWGAKKNAPIVDDLRMTAPAPQPPTQFPQTVSHPAQHASKPPRPITPPAAPAYKLLAYPVPVSLATSAFDGPAASDADFNGLVDKIYVNSIRQFHIKAAEADAKLARDLRRLMPAKDREWIVRAHAMEMEQMARDIVERRDVLISEERKKRGLPESKDNGADPAPPAIAKAQPPGAFPDEGIHVQPILEQLEEPEPEMERELEPDVDEEIVILPKSKGKKKGKKTVEVKPAVNGRLTPIAAARAATPAAKAAPVVEKVASTVENVSPAVEKKPVTPVSQWAAKAAVPGRSASPAPVAPINTGVGRNATTNGRNTLPPGMSPWEAAQAAKAASSSKAPAETMPPSPPNGIWAPPVARATSSKNPYAPTRPSRLAHVSEPESPEPPSPPPTREPTGQDYVAWFAGSSSEDEGADDGRLSEDEDEEDEDEDGPAPSSSFGANVLASLAGGSPWALFGEGQQPHKEHGRTASPARGRGATATPTPAMAAAGRFGADMGGMGMGMNSGMGSGTGMGAPEWMRWGAGGPSPPGVGAAPGPSGYRAVPGGYGAAPTGAGRQWQNQSSEDEFANMLAYASKTLDRAASAAPGARSTGAGVEEAMGMYIAAQKARETLVTPVGGRTASAWRR